MRHWPQQVHYEMIKAPVPGMFGLCDVPQFITDSFYNGLKSSCDSPCTQGWRTFLLDYMAAQTWAKIRLMFRIYFVYFLF